jgi:hypothetical protein
MAGRFSGRVINEVAALSFIPEKEPGIQDNCRGKLRKARTSNLAGNRKQLHGRLLNGAYEE